MYKKLFAQLSCVVMATYCSATTTQVSHDTSGQIKIVSIMSHAETGISTYNKNNIHCAETQNIIQDLNIAEIAKFFGCRTVIGSTFIAETLQSPVNSIDRDTILAGRQTAIKFLVANHAVRAEMGRLLEEAREAEQGVITLLSEFFKGKTCPELKNLELIRQQNPGLAPIMEFLLTHKAGKTTTTSLNVLGLGATLFAVRQFYPIIRLMIQTGNYNARLMGGITYLGLIAGLNVYTLYKDYSLASEKRTFIHALNRLVVISEKIEALCTKYGIITQFKTSNIKDVRGKALVHDLKSSRYQQKSCWFFSTPHVHSFLYQIYQQEKYLAEVLASIAEMDAYHAMATKMISSQKNNNKLCFVSFLDESKPRITMEGFWNVLVKNAVTNDISEDHHVILTGPNAGGKTTAIKAILQNIVLGQSFGIAAGTSCSFTMFDVISSYLNISDDLLNGLSLFASEIKRAQEIVEKIKTLTPHQKFFFALDELFTGTNAAEGEKCAYNFINRIADTEKAQFIYATHFDKLKELGNVHDHCANYQVGAPAKNIDGKLVYPFSLSEGASDCHVALDLAQEAHLFT